MTVSQAAGEGFDVIGDVHGMASMLVALLENMGYEEAGGRWGHPNRRAVFVGDLIDRGPNQVECVRIARAMVEAGTALIVAGNHEFNALAFATPDADTPGEFLRRHSDKNLRQHREFLAQVGEGSTLHREILEWFETLPLWLDLDGLRVVHACWDAQSIELLADRVSDANSVTDDLVVAGSRKGSPEWQAIEHLLKGPEIGISPSYLDKDGHLRDQARFRWWLPSADRLDFGAHIPSGATTADGQPYPDLEPVAIDPPVTPYRDEVPVIYGHYWGSGAPAATSEHTACVDYSACRAGGSLVAYRWSGESSISDANFVESGSGRAEL